MNWDAIREEFTTLKEITYINTASIGLIPKRALDAAREWLVERSFGNIHWRDWYSEAYEAKKLFAKLINADPSEIALVQNTSMGLNIIANSIPFRRGENIVLNDLEFPANVFPWQAVAKRFGLEVRVVRNRGGFISLDDYRKAVDEKTRVIAVSWVEFSNGFVHDLEVLSEIASSVNAYLVVDGIQGIGSLKIDVKKSGVDFLVSGSQKWLMGLPGAGFMYISRNVLDKLELSFGGWLSDEKQFDFSYREYRPAPDARRFEFGSPNFLGYRVLKETLSLLLSIGQEKVEERNLYLAQLIVDEIGKFAEIASPLKDGSPMSPIVSIKVGDAEKITKILFEKDKVVVTPRMGGVRVSPHFYNNEEDVEKFVKALKKYL